MNLRYSIIVKVLFLMSVASCDPVVTYNFEIVNKSNRRIKVTTSFNGKDSLAYLNEGNSFSAFRWDAINKPGDDYFDENIFILDEIEIFINDSIKIDNDFRSRALWRLRWENSYTGIYRLIITDKELAY